jgi:CRISPR/Cas system-associated protein Csm6
MKRLQSLKALKITTWQAMSRFVRARDKRCVTQELNTLYRTPKKWTREEIEAKRTSFTEAYEQLAFRGLGVVRESVVR